jgi:hypothetical protein
MPNWLEPLEPTDETLRRLLNQPVVFPNTRNLAPAPRHSGQPATFQSLRGVWGRVGALTRRGPPRRVATLGPRCRWRPARCRRTGSNQREPADHERLTSGGGAGGRAARGGLRTRRGERTHRVAGARRRPRRALCTPDVLRPGAPGPGTATLPIRPWHGRANPATRSAAWAGWFEILELATKTGTRRQFVSQSANFCARISITQRRRGRFRDCDG